MIEKNSRNNKKDLTDAASQTLETINRTDSICYRIKLTSVSLSAQEETINN